MYHVKYQQSSDSNVMRMELSTGLQSLRFTDVIRLWQDDIQFTNFFIEQLASIPYQAYFLELPPLTHGTIKNAFECVFVDSPALVEVSADDQPFSRFFSATATIVDFDNLGHDARLISPCPNGPVANFSHLAIFSRQVDHRLQQQLWQHVGQVLERRISATPMWVSTSGLGVYWLHIRLDTAPKYYAFGDYRDMDYFEKGGQNG